MKETPFVDERGMEHILQIEFATYQVTPKEQNTVSDSFCGTLDTGKQISMAFMGRRRVSEISVRLGSL
jgi:hypothetical protein